MCYWLGITSPAITSGYVAERQAAHARVTLLDNRRRGRADQRNGLAHTIGDYAADCAGVNQPLGLAPVVILADPPVSGPGRKLYP